MPLEDWGNFHRHVCRSSQVLTWFLPAVLNLFPKASDPPGLSKGMRLAIGLQGNEKQSAAAGDALFVASTAAVCRRFSCLKERILWKPEGAAKRPHSKTGWNQSSLAKQWRPNPAEVRLHKPRRTGMRSSLQGKRARLAGALHLPIGARHGSRDGQTVMVESEIPSISAPM